MVEVETNKAIEFSSWKCTCTDNSIPQNLINIKIIMKKGEKVNGKGI